MSSILNDTKKSLGIEADDTYFDPEIIMDINAVLLTINQIGIGPTTGFLITGNDETWESLLGARQDLDAVKTLIYLKVRLLFDPPTNSFVIKSIENSIEEFEWRLNNQAATTGGVT